MKRLLAWVGAIATCGWGGHVSGAEIDASLRAARALLAQPNPSPENAERLLGLAVDVAGGCPATVDAEPNLSARDERKRTINALIEVVAASGSRRDLIQLLRLSVCGISSPSWSREQLLERAMASTIERVPCLPPMSGAVSSERSDLADFPLLRLRKGALHADLPVPAELDDLAYFMVAVEGAGDEPAGEVRLGAAGKAPANLARTSLFQQLAKAKSLGNLRDIERYARSYLETLGFPDRVLVPEEDDPSSYLPRTQHVMLDLAESLEDMGRFHDAADLRRRGDFVRATAEAAAQHVRQDRIEAIIRDEEIDGRCEATIAERMLDVGGSPWKADDAYGPKRLVDARFDVARLLRGALLTINRDAGEAVVTKAIDALPPTTRLFAQMRLRNKGVEDWERRLQAARGLANVMQQASIPILLRAAEQSLPPGRQRVLDALADLAQRPTFDPCTLAIAGNSYASSEPKRPVRPLGLACQSNLSRVQRDRLARQLFVYANDQDPETRKQAVIALGKIAAPAARPVLRRLLRDDGGRCPHLAVCESARQALNRIEEIERNWNASR